MQESNAILFNKALFFRGLCLRSSCFVLLILLLIGIPSGLLAANEPKISEIDSLNKVLDRNLKPADKIQTMFALGKAYYSNMDLDNAIKNNTLLLEYISLHGTKKDSAKVMRYLGLVYMKKSLYDKSLGYLMKAQRLYGESGDSSQYATTLMNVGIIHDYMGNYPMALMYYNKSHDYFEFHKDKTGMANCGINISIVLTKQKKYDQAIKYLHEVSEIYKSTDNEPYLAASYMNLALAYKKLKNFDKTLEYMDKAYSIYIKNGEKDNICVYHLNMGEIYLEMKQVEKAGFHLHEAEKLSAIIGSKELAANAYDFLSDYHKAKNNYAKAYEYLLKGKIINDSVLNAQTTEKISQIQYQYEITQREADNEHLMKENLNKELQLSKKNTFLFILSGVIAIIALMVGFLYNQNRIKRRANALLEEKNRLIEKQKDELVTLNASKDKFLSILAHDIKNPLSTILGISELMYTENDKLTKEEKAVFTKDIHTLATNLFEIINTLLSWAVSQGGLTAINPQNFNMKTLVGKAARNLKTVAKQKSINIVVEGSDEIEVFADSNMLLSVLHNLISNAIKFTYKEGEIKIVIEKESNDYAKVSVIDNGIGLTEKSIEKLFQYDKHFLNKGTAGESGTGLGLILCKDFVEKNGGKIWVESEPKKGSTFRFTIPLS